MLEPGARCKVCGLSMQSELNGICVRLLELTHSISASKQVPRWKVVTDEGQGRMLSIRPEHLELCETQGNGDEKDSEFQCSQEAADEIRIDVSTGEAWSYRAYYAFYAKQKKYTQEELREYWLSKYRSVVEWPDDQEQKIDPVRGCLMTFRQYCEVYAGFYSRSQMLEYWNGLSPNVTPESFLDTDSRCEAERQELSPGFAARAARRAAANRLEQLHQQASLPLGTQATLSSEGSVFSELVAGSEMHKDSTKSPSKPVRRTEMAKEDKPPMQDRFKARARYLSAARASSQSSNGRSTGQEESSPGARRVSMSDLGVQLCKTAPRRSPLQSIKNKISNSVKLSDPSPEKASDSTISAPGTGLSVQEKTFTATQRSANVENMTPLCQCLANRISNRLHSPKRSADCEIEEHEVESTSPSRNGLVHVARRGLAMRSIPQTQGWGLLYLR